MNIRSPDLITRLGELLATHAPEAIVSAYLFGSAAEVRTHRESDIDVAALFRYELAPSSRDRFEEALAAVADPTRHR